MGLLQPLGAGFEESRRLETLKNRGYEPIALLGGRVGGFWSLETLEKRGL
jgi:hypothetical protein